MSSRRHFLRAFAATCLALGLFGQASAQDKKVYTVMVVPQFPAVRINETWTPLLEELGKRLSAKFELAYEQDIPSFEKKFLKGTPDIIYCNPYHAVMASKAQGYVPIVRGKKDLKGILIAPASGDGAITDMKQLEGKTLLFPAPNAFGASLYMRALLKTELGLNFEAKYVKTHPNVIRGVVRGEGAAGGMVMRTLNEEADGIRSRVKVIYETPPAASHPIAVHKRLGENMIAKIQSNILDILEKNPEIADNIQLSGAKATQYAPEYEKLEKLGLEKFAKID